MADNPSSSHQKLVLEFCTRDLDPAYAHKTQRKLVPETWHLRFRWCQVFIPNWYRQGIN